MSSVYDMAVKYYPRLWSKARLDTLLAVGKLTKAEYDAIIPSKPEFGTPLTP